MENNEHNLINIEVAFATKDKQLIVPLSVRGNISVLDAIWQSNISAVFPEINVLLASDKIVLGIFGKKIDHLTYQLKEHDRIEIYRPLSKTPNQKRLERAKIK